MELIAILIGAGVLVTLGYMAGIAHALHHARRLGADETGAFHHDN